MSSNEYGKIFKRAWGDPDFKALTADEQLLYFKLISQPDVSLAGVLTYAPMRWAMQTTGLDVDEVERTFGGLSRKRYVVVDLDTQEVLVRSYIRNDLGWRSPRTMIGIANAIARVLSPLLRGVISRELTRLDTDTLSATINEKTNRSTREVVEGAIRGVLEQFPPLDTLSPTLFSESGDTHTNTVSDGVSAVRTLNYNGNSNSSGSGSSSSSDKKCASAADASPALLPAPKPIYSEDFEEFWAKWPNAKNKKTAQDAFAKALKLTTLDALIAAIPPMLAEYERKGWDVPMAATWLNQERWNDEYATTTSADSDEWTDEPEDPDWLYQQQEG